MITKNGDRITASCSTAGATVWRVMDRNGNEAIYRLTADEAGELAAIAETVAKAQRALNSSGRKVKA